MGLLIWQSRPNRKTVNDNTSTVNTWFLIGLSGNAYTSLANCYAAGDVPLIQGATQNSASDNVSLTVTSRASNGGAGNAFMVFVGPQTTPPPAGTTIPSGTAYQDVSLKGTDIVWYQKTTGTDTIQFSLSW